VDTIRLRHPPFVDDDLLRLRHNRRLFKLLTHYGRAAQTGRDAWHDRLMEFEGLSAKELSRLHGELLAHGWLEHNPDAVSCSRRGAVPACYRTTEAGLRAILHAQSSTETLPHAA
jgi:hypothetical protein